MAELSGYGGSLTYGADVLTNVIGIYSWTLDINCDALEITDEADSGSRTYIRGLKGWTGTAEGYFDSAQSSYVCHTNVGGSLNLALKIDGSSYYYGAARLTAFNPSAPVDGVITVSYAFQGSGALTYP